jgi:hypothetical protein
MTKRNDGVKRWNTRIHCPPAYDIEREEAKDGDYGEWVTSEDHDAAMAKLQDAIHEAGNLTYKLEAELAEARKEIAELSIIKHGLAADVAKLRAELSKHEQALKDAVRVYGWDAKPHDTTWDTDKWVGDTHTGLLINVEKIGAKDGE